MNTSDQLNPEERELARLLGRPSATLAPNARIAAAIAEMAQQRHTAAAQGFRPAGQLCQHGQFMAFARFVRVAVCDALPRQRHVLRPPEQHGGGGRPVAAGAPCFLIIGLNRFR